jgi:hypothetical protein
VPSRDDASADAAIVARGLSKNFKGDVRAVRGLDLSVGQSAQVRRRIGVALQEDRPGPGGEGAQVATRDAIWIERSQMPRGAAFLTDRCSGCEAW